MKFSTEDCAFCYLSKGTFHGIATSNRKPNQRHNCDHCSSTLLPKGSITKSQYFCIEIQNHEIQSGFMVKVLKDEDNKEEWFLAHTRQGKESPLFPLIGQPASTISNHVSKSTNANISWPKSPELNKIFPASK
jgi:hypothetical protein